MQYWLTGVRMKSPRIARWGRIFLGISAALALTSGARSVEDIAAGKTPAQSFNSDCSECHHSPTGLAKGQDASTLARFLVEHYTTKPEYARQMAAYLVGFTVAVPPPRTRHDAGPPVIGGGEARPPEADKPRPPGQVAVIPGGAAREGASRAGGAAPNRRSETIAPLEAISAYLGSILGAGGTKPAVTKPGSPRIADIKGRHPKPHRHRQDSAEPRGEPAQEPKVVAAPAAAAEPQNPVEPPTTSSSAGNSDARPTTAASPPSSSHRPLHRRSHTS